MAINVLSGATLGFSAASPATDDEAGYEALTFTSLPAAQIADFAGFDDSWETKVDDSYSTSGAKERKLRKMFGQIPMTLKYDKTNTALYGILETAYASQTDAVSVKFLSSNGVDAKYFTALVLKANFKGGSSSDDETFEVVLAPQTESVDGTDS